MSADDRRLMGFWMWYCLCVPIITGVDLWRWVRENRAAHKAYLARRWP